MGKSYANFMCKKFFHPASYDNIKRVWMAQQRTDAEKARQDGLRAEYERDQETYNNRQIMGDEKVKHGLTFMYEPPKGFKSDDKEKGPDGEPEYKFEWQRSAPCEGYAKNMDVTDQPFGIAVRKVKCVRCHNWGHVNTDRECPLFNSSKDEPISGPSSDKTELIADMRKDGLVLKQNAMDRKVDRGASNQQIIPSDDEGEIPEAAFLQTLSTKDKKKLLKKLKDMERPNELRKKSKKNRKQVTTSEDDSSEDSDGEERKRKKKRGHKSEDQAKDPGSDKKNKRKQKSDKHNRNKYSESESDSDSASSEREMSRRKRRRNELENRHKKMLRVKSESDSEDERRGSHQRGKKKSNTDDVRSKEEKYSKHASDDGRRKSTGGRKRKELSDGRTDSTDEDPADERSTEAGRVDREHRDIGRSIKREEQSGKGRERSRGENRHHESSRSEDRHRNDEEKRYRRGRSSSGDDEDNQHGKRNESRGEKSGRKAARREGNRESPERRSKHHRHN